MEIGYTPEQLAMQQELRGYYDKLLDPATVAELHESHAVGEAPRRIWKQMCSDGWAGIGWPKEYGGQGRSAIEQFIFFDESMRAGAPVPMLTLNSVGPTIMAFGTDEQKADYLPRILAGDVHFCIGYSEPGAGTDLASLQTRAVRDGDSYVINGQKMWTSISKDADYCWLAVRTDPDAAKHKGISIIIVPMDTPGITLSPLHLLGTHDINAVFYEDVIVPAANVVGGPNHGWKLITNQLNHERVTLFASGVMERALNEVTEYAQETKLPDGRRVIDQEWVQPREAPHQGRGRPAHELAGGVGGDAGRPRHRPLLRAQGVRERAQHGGLPAPHGDRRAGVLPRARRSRRGVAFAPAIGHPRLHHPHLRWWGQRDATRPDLPVHPGPPEG
jgi:alkylation response protein AidB-like acyl-CoA dehydrogenase